MTFEVDWRFIPIAYRSPLGFVIEICCADMHRNRSVRSIVMLSNPFNLDSRIHITAMNIALKYRPSSFKDLVGQDILVRILENAFTLNKIPQSILLSGSSGIGKTTTARIIALCLNCSLGPTTVSNLPKELKNNAPIKGVVVTSVDSSSNSTLRVIKKGDIIIQLDGIVIENTNDFQEQIDSAVKKDGKDSRSLKATAVLNDEQLKENLTPKKLIMGIKTRWNSTYYMVQRAIELEKFLKISYALLDLLEIPCLTTTEWIVLKSFEIQLKLKLIVIQKEKEKNNPSSENPKPLETVLYESEATELSAWNIFQKAAKEHKPSSTNTKLTKAIMELDRYMNTELLQRNQDPTYWWRNHYYEFPLQLVKLAKTILISSLSAYKRGFLSKDVRIWRRTVADAFII
ncbi:hypothetical protein PGB90_006767 [Kerria lacca]